MAVNVDRRRFTAAERAALDAAVGRIEELVLGDPLRAKRKVVLTGGDCPPVEHQARTCRCRWIRWPGRR